MMADGRNPQQTMMLGAWQDADSAERCRWQQLGFACDRFGDADLLLLMGLIYRNTRQGLGSAWRPENGWRTILSDPWAPRCKRSKVLRLIADARDAGILRVVAAQEQFGNPAGSAYQIDWAGVYAIRGLPLPELLRSISSEPESGRRYQPDWMPEASTPVDTPSTPVDTPSTPVDTPSMASNGNLSQRAPGRAFDLIRFEEENFIFTSNHLTAADAVVRTIYRHRGRGPSLSRRSRVFLLSAVVLAEHLGQFWLDDAVEATAEHKADTPPAYLWICLENGLVDNLGIPKELFRRLLACVRMAAQRFLQENPWHPEGAFARKISVQETGESEISEEEKDAVVEAHLTKMDPALRNRAMKTLDNLKKARAEI